MKYSRSMKLEFIYPWTKVALVRSAYPHLAIGTAISLIESFSNGPK